MTNILTTTNPFTGKVSATDIDLTSVEQVDSIVTAAAAAAATLRQKDRAWRARMLELMADELDADSERLVELAQTETGLSQARLTGEVTRSSFQLRLFAEAVREGSYLEATIDHAGSTPMGDQPDVRRMMLPIGPVAVFGSSNFPFAFSVPGGDTASALAAGNSVVVKAHSAHPLTSRASYEALRRGADKAGAPESTVNIVYGQASGTELVAHPGVQAVGFTGSQGAAERLMEVISTRSTPIPFYGELQSINPVLVSASALEARAEDIAAGLALSVTGSAGQLCTKPGFVFVPAGDQGEQFTRDVTEKMAATAPGVLLNERVLTSFQHAEHTLESASGVESLLNRKRDEDANGFAASPRVLRIHARELSEDHTLEAFGPLVMLVVYDSFDEVLEAMTFMPDSLTFTVHAEDGDKEQLSALLQQLEDKSGRFVYNGFPTGVRVSWAQNHGGPWPATNNIHTSVGVAAMRRFLRPFAWQSTPQELLPAELRDDFDGIPRRINGVLEINPANAQR